MNEYYTSKEKDILSYLSKQNLSQKNNGNYSITKIVNLRFNKKKEDDTSFEMNRDELVEFLTKRQNKDFSKLDKDLKMANINIDESFYVTFY